MVLTMVQLERALSKKHKVYKLSVSDEGAAFKGYDVLLSTHIRAKQVIIDAIPKADLIIVDEAHRVSPNGTGYKKILEEFKNTNSPLYKFLLNKWYIDELYIKIFVNPTKKIGSFFWNINNFCFKFFFMIVKNIIYTIYKQIDNIFIIF